MSKWILVIFKLRIWLDSPIRLIGKIKEGFKKKKEQDD